MANEKPNSSETTETKKVLGAKIDEVLMPRVKVRNELLMALERLLPEDAAAVPDSFQAVYGDFLSAQRALTKDVQESTPLVDSLSEEFKGDDEDIKQLREDVTFIMDQEKSADQLLEKIITRFTQLSGKTEG